MLVFCEDFSNFINNTKLKVKKIQNHTLQNKNAYMMGGGLISGLSGLNYLITDRNLQENKQSNKLKWYYAKLISYKGYF